MTAVINVHVWSDRGEKLRTIERETGCTVGQVFERLVQRADTSPLGLRALFPENFTPKGDLIPEPRIRDFEEKYERPPSGVESLEEANRRAAVARADLIEAQTALLKRDLKKDGAGGVMREMYGVASETKPAPVEKTDHRAWLEKKAAEIERRFADFPFQPWHSGPGRGYKWERKPKPGIVATFERNGVEITVRVPSYAVAAEIEKTTWELGSVVILPPDCELIGVKNFTPKGAA